MKDLLYSSDQEFFIDGVQLSGVQSVRGEYNIPSQANNFLGHVGSVDVMQEAPGQASFSISRKMITSDESITDLIGGVTFNGGITYNGKKLGFGSGCLTSYGVSFEIDSIPDTDFNVTSYGDLGPSIEPIKEIELTGDSEANNYDAVLLYIGLDPKLKLKIGDSIYLEGTNFNYSSCGSNPQINWNNREYIIYDVNVNEYGLATSASMLHNKDAISFCGGEYTDGGVVSKVPEKPFVPSSSGISLECDGRATNRVTSFSYNVDVPKKPIYKIGSFEPCQIMSMKPIRNTLSVQLEVDDYETKSVYDSIKTGIHEKNLKITARDKCDPDRSISYTMDGARLISESFSINPNNETLASLKYESYSNDAASIKYTDIQQLILKDGELISLSCGDSPVSIKFDGGLFEEMHVKFYNNGESQLITVANGSEDIPELLLIWDSLGDGKHVFSEVGETITRTILDCTFEIRYDGAGSQTFTITNPIEDAWVKGSDPLKYRWSPKDCHPWPELFLVTSDPCKTKATIDITYSFKKAGEEVREQKTNNIISDAPKAKTETLESDGLTILPPMREPPEFGTCSFDLFSGDIAEALDVWKKAFEYIYPWLTLNFINLGEEAEIDVPYAERGGLDSKDPAKAMRAIGGKGDFRFGIHWGPEFNVIQVNIKTSYLAHAKYPNLHPGYFKYKFKIPALVDSLGDEYEGTEFGHAPVSTSIGQRRRDYLRHGAGRGEEGSEKWSCETPVKWFGVSGLNQGYCHFDSNEKWTTDFSMLESEKRAKLQKIKIDHRNPEENSVKKVAVHEIGHIFGLAHSAPDNPVSQKGSGIYSIMATTDSFEPRDVDEFLTPLDNRSFDGLFPNGLISGGGATDGCAHSSNYYELNAIQALYGKSDGLGLSRDDICTKGAKAKYEAEYPVPKTDTCTLSPVPTCTPTFTESPTPSESWSASITPTETEASNTLTETELCPVDHHMKCVDKNGDPCIDGAPFFDCDCDCIPDTLTETSTTSQSCHLCNPDYYITYPPSVSYTQTAWTSTSSMYPLLHRDPHNVAEKINQRLPIPELLEVTSDPCQKPTTIEISYSFIKAGTEAHDLHFKDIASMYKAGMSFDDMGRAHICTELKGVRYWTNADGEITTYESSSNADFINDIESALKEWKDAFEFIYPWLTLNFVSKGNEQTICIPSCDPGYNYSLKHNNDIGDIRFGMHGIDGPNVAIAHTRPLNHPRDPLVHKLGTRGSVGGDVHFDSLEYWRKDSKPVTEVMPEESIKYTAAHEIGHIFGLLHCEDPSSLMFYGTEAPTFGDNVRGIYFATDFPLGITGGYLGEGEKINKGKDPSYFALADIEGHFGAGAEEISANRDLKYIQALYGVPGHKQDTYQIIPPPSPTCTPTATPTYTPTFTESPTPSESSSASYTTTNTFTKSYPIPSPSESPTPSFTFTEV